MSHFYKDCVLAFLEKCHDFEFFFPNRVVKEEIVDESTVLPVFNGRVISWVR